MPQPSRLTAAPAGFARLATLALCAGTLGMTACSDRSAETDAVDDAARKLAAVGSPGAETSGGYASVASELASLSPDDAFVASVVSGLESQSLQGVGSQALERMMLAERAARIPIDEAREHLRRWTVLMTTAEALEAFDPAADVRRIEREASEIEGLAREARVDRAELAEQIEGLRTRIESLRSRSDELRNRAAQMRLDSSSVSATRAAEMARDIRELAREADGLDREANRLSGEVASLEPRLAEADAEIAKLEQQRELALQSAGQLEQLAQTKRAEAETARAEARERARLLAAAVEAASQQRSGPVAETREEAIDALARAVREGEAAARQARTTGRIGAAAAQRRLAEAHQLASHGFEAYADLMAELANASPTLPDASAYRQTAGEASDRAAQHRAEAADAYDAVASSLTNTGIRGAEGEALAQTAERFQSLAQSLRGAAPGDAGGVPATPAPAVPGMSDQN